MVAKRLFRTTLMVRVKGQKNEVLEEKPHNIEFPDEVAVMLASGMFTACQNDIISANLHRLLNDPSHASRPLKGNTLSITCDTLAGTGEDHYHARIDYPNLDDQTIAVVKQIIANRVSLVTGPPS